MSELFQLLNHPVISERYFFPRPGAPKNPVDFYGADGVRLRCSRSQGTEHPKTLVHFHGNGEIVADYDDGYLEQLEALGVNVLMVEYRGYGDSEGYTELAKMLSDVACVREQCGLSPQETIVYGRSVGGIFAVEWAKQEPSICGLILESAVADPYQRLVMRLEPAELSTTEAMLSAACHKYLDHREKLSEYKNPLLVLHAALDTLVEPEHARAHMEYAASLNKKLVLFPRGDHNTIMAANWQDYIDELASFIQSC